MAAVGRSPVLRTITVDPQNGRVAEIRDEPVVPDWVGRWVYVELTTGSKLFGRITRVGGDYIETDTGMFRIPYVIHLRWVSAAEAAILRQGTGMP